MTIIVRENTTITGNLVVNEEVQIAAGVTVTIAAGANVDLGGNNILNYGTLLLKGTSEALAGLANFKYFTQNTAGLMRADYGSIQSGVVDGFASSGSLQLVSTVVENSRLDGLAANSIVNSVLLHTTVDIGTRGGTISGTTFKDSEITKLGWNGGPTLTVVNSNFIHDGLAVVLDPFFALPHNVHFSSNYLFVPPGSNFESKVYDADDSLRASTNLDVSSFSSGPYLNDVAGVRIGPLTLSLADLGIAPIRLAGSMADDYLAGGAQIEVIEAGAGNDVMVGAGGNDVLNGGSGLDTAVYAGSRGQYSLTSLASANTVRVVATTGVEGIDILANVERFYFSDYKVAYDLNGSAGTTAKILSAVFGKEAIANKEDAGIGLYALDSGMSYKALIELAINARFGATVSDQSLVEQLYLNVVGAPPSVAERDSYVQMLINGTYDRGSLAIMAAETKANWQNVELMGVPALGLEYIL